MKIPYLIQRGKIKSDVDPQGNLLTDIVELEYMGAAEYEYGSLADSSSRIKSGKYKVIDVTILDSNITVYCSISIDNEVVIKYLNDIAKRTHRTKGKSMLPEAINPTPSDKKWQIENPLGTNFWWDIENDVMFWLSDEQFENNIKKVL